MERPGGTRVGKMLEKSKAVETPQKGREDMGDPWIGLQIFAPLGMALPRAHST